MASINSCENIRETKIDVAIRESMVCPGLTVAVEKLRIAWVLVDHDDRLTVHSQGLGKPGNRLIECSVVGIHNVPDSKVGTASESMNHAYEGNVSLQTIKKSSRRTFVFNKFVVDKVFLVLASSEYGLCLAAKFRFEHGVLY